MIEDPNKETNLIPTPSRPSLKEGKKGKTEENVSKINNKEQEYQLTWPNNSYKHQDHIPCLQQSMDIDDFDIDF